MRVVLVTLYDHYCLGARLLVSNLAAHGHDPYLVMLKRFQTRAFRFSDPVEMEECRRIMEESGNLPVLEFRGDYDGMCPYPDPIREVEKEIFYEKLRQLQPEVIGFSLTSAFMPAAKAMTLEVRRRFPRVPVVWGGIHPILLPEDGVGYADAICTNEGDECFPEWLRDPRRTDLEGFWFCRDGAVTRNPRGNLPQHLDRFPFPSYGDRSREFLVEDGCLQYTAPRAYGEYLFMTQRGCPFKCTYCLHAKTRDFFPRGLYLRRRSVGNVLDEVEAARNRFRFESVAFADDIFMFDRRWIEEFCEQYRRRFPGFPFGAYGHYQFTDPEMLRNLRESGCSFTGIGIQSGSEYVNEHVYRRKESPEDVVRFAHAILDAGIEKVVYDLLTNSRFEREHDCRATLDLICRLPKPVKISIKKIQSYPGSAYAELKLPDGGVSERDFHFYNLLYLLAAQPGIEAEFVKRLAGRNELRAEPEPLERLVGSLARANEEALEAEQRLGRMARELEEERSRMPWGVRRAAAHLARQLGRKVGLPKN